MQPDEPPDKTKRTFLIGAGATFGAIYGSTIDVLFRPAIERGKDSLLKIFSGYTPNEALQETMDPVEEKHIELVKRLIGLDSGKVIKFAGGRDHYLYPKVMHPDNELSLNTATKLLTQLGQTFQQETAGDFDSKGSFVCFGGPISNLRSANFLGYHRIDVSRPQRGFRRLKAAPLKLGIQFELDTEKLRRRGLIAKGGIHNDPTPEWAIKLGEERDSFLQTKAGKVDYLLVSRLPNWIEPSSSLKNKFSNVVTVFAGCHGAGAGAVRLLFNNGGLLTRLDMLTRQHKYWQALIGIRHIETLPHPITGTLRYQAVALEPELVASAPIYT